MAYNEHYNSQEIDTIKLWKANKSLQSLVDVCEFNIDKYNRRPKENEEIKDTGKAIFYMKLKKEALLLIEETNPNYTFNYAKRLVRNTKNNP